MKRLVLRMEAPKPDQPSFPATGKDQGGSNGSQFPKLSETPLSKEMKLPVGPIRTEQLSPPPSLTHEPTPPAPPLPSNDRGPVEPIPWKDPLKLTHDDEVKIGKAVHELILKHHPVLQPPAEAVFRDQLHTLVLPFLRLRSRKDDDPRIYLVDSDEAFAFSHLGGYIYVSTYLSRLAAQDVELEFVLAHEIAHLDMRHGIEKAARELAAEAQRTDQPGLVRRIYHQIADGYDSKQEYDADEWACQQLVNLKRSRHDIRMFFERLKDYNARKQGVEPHKPMAVLDAKVQDIENHWQTHPAIPYRLEHLKAFLDAPPSQPARLEEQPHKIVPSRPDRPTIIVPKAKTAASGPIRSEAAGK